MGLDAVSAGYRCDGCGDAVDPSKPGTWREVTGLVQARKGGGAHGVKNQAPTGRYFCKFCADNPSLRGQGAML